MRLCPVINRTPAILVLACALLLAPLSARAQTSGAPLTPAQAMDMQRLAAALSGGTAQGYGGMPQQGQMPGGAQDVMNAAAQRAAKGAVDAAAAPAPVYRPHETTMTQAQLDAALQNNDSPEAHADRLAAQAKYQRDLEKSVGVDTDDFGGEPGPPQDMIELQGLGEGMAPGKALDDASDNAVKSEAMAAIDMRRDAQKQAALSFGARGGLAKRNFEIMERMKGFESTLDNVFNFRALLVKAPSGLMIEPPIVREADNSLVVTANGNEAAVADKIYDINKQAKIVTAPRDWRSYLLQRWTSSVPRPPHLLWPRTAAERADWNGWVAEGWRAGAGQAEEMFETNLARLVADYRGMVRYRMLLTQGMISQPYAMHEDRGVTGTKTVMRVGDRALRITGPSQFLTGSDLWKPADR